MLTDVKSRPSSAMQIKFLGLFIVLTSCWPTNAGAQEPVPLKREIFVSAGWDHLFRFEDISHNGAGIGGGFGLLLQPRFALELEFNSMSGLSPRPVPCGAFGRFEGGVIVPLPCVGTARTGLDSFSVGSANVRYYFSESRVQPYVSGGLGAAWSKEFVSNSFPTDTEVTLTEDVRNRAGFSWNIGAGARVFVASRISVRPEIRLYDATILSRQNLTLFRLSMGLGFHW